MSRHRGIRSLCCAALAVSAFGLSSLLQAAGQAGGRALVPDRMGFR